MTKSRIIEWVDIFIAVLMSALVFVYYWWGIDALEFFRHTEADRALIGWEMQETGNYLVPHLLGSSIYTKPPLFYWLLAAFIHVFDSAQVVVVRLPSLIFASTFCGLQYLFLRIFGFTRALGFWGSIMLAFGGMFFVHADQAEIDLVFAVFCWLSLYFVYFAVNRQSLSLTMASYFFAALAFLTKGPPAIIFLGFVSVAYFFCCKKFIGFVKVNGLRFINSQVLGIILFVVLVGLWTSVLAYQVGYQELIHWFNTEFYNRITQEARYKRGGFYYLPLMMESALPWSLWLLLSAVLAFFPFWRKHLQQLNNERQLLKFVVFNTICLLTIVFLLSLSAGKSPRYFLPAYAFIINLCLVAALSIINSPWRDKVYKLSALTCIFLGSGLLLLPQLNDQVKLLFTFYPVGLWATILGLVFVAFCFYFERMRRICLVFAFAFLFLVIRYNYIYAFCKMRNQDHSVIAVAKMLDDAVPAGEPIYNLELFERWINYYLKLNGRISYRLDPIKKEELLRRPGYIYVLLNEEEEGWRIKVLEREGVAFKIVEQVVNTTNPIILVLIPTDALRHWGIRERFPTTPTPAFSL